MNSPLPLLKGPKPTFTLHPPSFSLCKFLPRHHPPFPGQVYTSIFCLAQLLPSPQMRFSAEGSYVPRSDFPRNMNTPGSCRRAWNGLCQQTGWSASPCLADLCRRSRPAWLIMAKAVLLDLANTPRALHQIWACALASSLSHLYALISELFFALSGIF